MNEPIATELAQWLAEHLQAEEALLSAALPVLRALRADFNTIPTGLADEHIRLTHQVEAMRQRRRQWRDKTAARLVCAPAAVTVSRILERLPGAWRAPLRADAERVRALANEAADLNQWLNVHLRIYLNAYRRVLRDLTRTAHQSGRYGPAGKAEVNDFRPLIQIRG